MGEEISFVFSFAGLGVGLSLLRETISRLGWHIHRLPSNVGLEYFYY